MCNSQKIKRDTNTDLMMAVLQLVKENGWYDEAENIMDYFRAEEGYVKELSNYEFDFKAVVEYSGNEGVYLYCYLEGSFDENDIMNDEANIPCGIFKTLGDSLKHTRIMGELAGSLTFYARKYIYDNFVRFCPSEN